jgi:hypothetical protein
LSIAVGGHKNQGIKTALRLLYHPYPGCQSKNAINTRHNADFPGFRTRRAYVFRTEQTTGKKTPPLVVWFFFQNRNIFRRDLCTRITHAKNLHNNMRNAQISRGTKDRINLQISLISSFFTIFNIVTQIFVNWQANAQIGPYPKSFPRRFLSPLRTRAASFLAGAEQNHIRRRLFVKI